MSLSLTELSAKLAQIILPIIIIIGVIGNTLNIYILTRRRIRNHAGSYYFLALASNNLIYSIFIIYYLFANGYDRDAQLVSNVLCKIFQYIGSACPFLSPYFIVCASIDRYLASSSNPRRREYSNASIAQRVIVTVITCSLLFFINSLVLIELRNDGFGCNLRIESIYHQIFAITEILLYTVIPPCLMLTFGLLTIYNTNRVHVITHRTSRYRRTENQLIRMLLIQVITYILLSTPLCIIYLILILPTGYKPTTDLFFAYTFVEFSFHFSYATPFFLYILSARLFREELIKLIGKFLKIRIRNRVHSQSVPQTQFIRNERQ